MRKLYLLALILLAACSTRKETAEELYYTGRDQFDEGNFNAAVVSLSKAEAIAADDITKALIYKEIALVYQAAFNPYEEAKYHGLAAKCYEKAGETRERLWSIFDMGRSFEAAEDGPAAEQIYRAILKESYKQKDTLLEVRCLEAYSAFLLDKSTPDPATSIEMLFRVGMNLKYPLGSQDASTLCYAYWLMGDKDEAFFWLKEAKEGAESEEDNYRLNLRTYQIMSAQGKSKEALEALESITEYRQTREIKGLRASVLSSQKEYFREQGELSHQHLDSVRQGIRFVRILALVLFILIIIFFRYLRLREKRKIEAEKQENERILALAEDLRSRLADAQNAAASSSAAAAAHAQKSSTLEKMGFSVLERLCEQYYIYEGTEDLQPKLLREARNVIEGLRSDTSNLEKTLDSQKDGLISRFRSEMPKVKEDDVKIFCFLVAGFNSTTISTLIEKDKQAVYNKIWRLKTRISDSDIPGKDIFLSYFSK